MTEKERLETTESHLSTLALFLTGLAGGTLAFLIGTPMPFLLGGVLGSSFFVLILERSRHRLKKPHAYVRLCAIAATGAMIGSRVTPDILLILPAYWPTALAIVPFIIIAHAGCYALLRYIGKYTATDAYFASMPGGLIEAVLMGEKAGADVRVLTVQHVIRIVSVVVIVPLIFFIATGEVVGSAGGMSLDIEPYDISDIVMIFLIAVVGLLVGKILKLPASHMLGPLVLAMVLTVSGTITIHVPGWLLHLAQYVIGVALGAQFSGMNRQLLRRGISMGMLATAYMLVLGYGFAVLLAPVVPATVPTLFLGFAAGGLAEMSLIALSLNVSPIIVALHHLLRIFLTIWIGNQIYQRLIKAD